MAKLSNENIRFSATIGNLCYYVMHNRTYLRTKSTLDRKRVLKSKEFEKTRNYASKFAIAAKLASPIYKALPFDIRARWIYRTIAGEAASLLYIGKSEQEVNDILWEKYIHGKSDEPKQPAKGNSAKPSSNKKVSAKELKTAFVTRWELQGKIASDFKKAWKDPRSYDPDTVRRLNNSFGHNNFLW